MGICSYDIKQWQLLRRGRYAEKESGVDKK